MTGTAPPWGCKTSGIAADQDSLLGSRKSPRYFERFRSYAACNFCFLFAFAQITDF